MDAGEEGALSGGGLGEVGSENYFGSETSVVNDPLGANGSGLVADNDWTLDVTGVQVIKIRKI